MPHEERPDLLSGVFGIENVKKRLRESGNPYAISFADLLDETSSKKTALESKSGYVYFIQAANGGPIKIGYSGSPRIRLAQMQKTSPEGLTLLAVIKGPQNKEKALHTKFSDLRLHGEWFKPEKKLLSFIDSINRTNRGNSACQTTN